MGSDEKCNIDFGTIVKVQSMNVTTRETEKGKWNRICPIVLVLFVIKRCPIALLPIQFNNILINE